MFAGMTIASTIKFAVGSGRCVNKNVEHTI
uniref:Uncharacterized protein n=1 Tax=Rhizophora mucronata TaxID=61149 RepID=A0A2P2QII9_RHIMU